MTNPIVIDISHYQPQPDWEKVKANGTIGVILKATEGTGYSDPTYGGREIGAREAGLLTSTYHFLRPGRIEEQMAWYLSVVTPAPGERLVIDFEDDDCTFDELERAAEFLLGNTDCEVTVYGSNVLVETVGTKTSPILSKTSLWQARYSSSPPKVPTSIWQTWSLWQYTDKAQVVGINGNVDGNKWNGDPARLPGWFDANAVQPQPEPGPVPPEVPVPVVRLDIGLPEGVELELYINGKEITG